MTPHIYQARIYYADTDAGGVVYHANYLTLAERARTECLRDLGIPHASMTAEHDCLFMVRRVELEYLRPARLDDMLTITTHFLAQTAATLSLRQVFALADSPPNPHEDSARLLVELVCVRASTGKPARTPPAWRFDLS
jgi:acyl-CoA thioester hydrolase